LRVIVQIIEAKNPVSADSTGIRQVRIEERGDIIVSVK